ncbi:aldolase [Mycolicibacillus parakoreensis]|uniref:Aldolase/citrate lyase family protein n=2 Tax=Mycobacteriaceae TaxID=1762 RepID=A0ABY3U186_9MYCO|nr:aldolase/citrate lyase family protein [Mycolicibacillus parakoreensis]MCV7316987.1 aldolase [Mycolicibacillus parakoreensis]ULN51327.1 aldolase/citrate lyase family protein [Mycolicibacillus parakoreensis]
MSSALRDGLRNRSPLWGGWITAPTVVGPDGFCSAGYDYVGFDAQHSYLDDADIAALIRGVAHLPIATAVRLPSADPAPIGRVLDAGADAVIVAMIETAEQAAAVVAATRFAPQGRRSFGPLRADLGRDITTLQDRADVFVMIETAAALADIDRICGVPGLTGIYVGPADLAISMGVEVGEATTHPDPRAAMVGIQRSAAAAGLITGIHAGSGAAGRDVAGLGYQMITLAAESHALRRGAAAHLHEARGAS